MTGNIVDLSKTLAKGGGSLRKSQTRGHVVITGEGVGLTNV